MTKDELIAKQQLEIEDLKGYRRKIVASAQSACNELIYVQQWSIKDEEFPRVAMNGVVKAERFLRNI